LEEENNLYEGDIEDLKNDNRVYKQRFEESESKFEKLIKESIKKDDRINDHEKTIKEIKKELKTKASTKLQARVAVKDDNNNNNNNDTTNSLQKRLSQLEQEKDKLLMNCNRASSAFFEEKDKCDEKDKIIKQLQNELKGKTSIKIKIEK
jgi:chromosome segregation ATPase